VTVKEEPKPPIEESVENLPTTPNVKMADAEAHVFQKEIDGDLMS